MDLINGNYKYNYEKRDCPIIINSGKYGKDSKLTMSISEPTVLYFNEHLNQYNISYKINDDSNYDNFVAFSFMFNEQSIFNIKILNDEIAQNETSFQFVNSTSLFLNSTYINKINDYIDISINYNEKLNKSIFLIFKPIQKESISILQKDYINKGFITSSTKYQYYYLKVFKGEEGELMIHNKRINGRLFGEIIKNNSLDIYNKNNYPIEESNLTFNDYTLKIKFNFNDTKDCQDGCYLLITYFHKNLQYINTSVGYEFTLLVRTWDDLDLSPQRINIPFNELIFGHFEEDSINNHYYSIFIPNEIDEIIIQIGGNFFEGFIGAGRKKLITTKKMDDIKNLGITNDKMMIRINLSDFDINSNKYISFAFRPKDYFVNTLSFYFFRILYPIYNNNNLILPLDSNIGNICQPKKEPENEDIFYCYFSLYNNYNQFSLKYSLSISQQIKDINIAYSTFNNKTKIKDYSTQNFFSSEDNDDDSDLIQFKFEFFDNQTKNILLAFEDGSNEIVPNIYSSQIYQINNIKKTLKIMMTDIFSLMFNWICGNGYIDVITNENEDLTINNGRNFKAKPLLISLDKVNNIAFRSSSIFIFYLKFKYIMKNKGVEELAYGEVINELIINKQFPLYYYIKNTENMTNIIFRELNYNINEMRKINYNIEAYILEYENIEKIMKGEYIQQLEKKFESSYDAVSKISHLKINETNTYNKYILIKINNKNNFVIKNDMIQLMTLYKNKFRYILPINQYITGDFDLFGKKGNDDTYLVQINTIDKMNDEIMIELIPNYNEIKLDNISCGNISINSTEILQEENGIKKYRISKCNNSFYITIKNIRDKLNPNYILRYYYSNRADENTYTFSKIYKIHKIKEFSNDKVFITLEFDNIKIYRNKKHSFNSKLKCNYKIYSFLFIKENIIKDEKIDTLAFLSSKPSYEDEILVLEDDPKFNISFKNISRDNYNYVLQIKVHIIINDTFFNEDYLVYSLPINLKKQLEKANKTFYLILGLVAVIIIIVSIFIIVYIKIKKKNIELKEKVLSISFSSGISKDILSAEQHASKKDEEYETTFI